MLFLAIQNTYDGVEFGVFDDYCCIERITLSKIQASGRLIPALDAILTKHNKTYQQVSFCSVLVGPGPFTTLRTVIATMNGLAYATGIPLVGVNAFESLICEYDYRAEKNVCALFKAFGGDVYYGFRKASEHAIVYGVQLLSACIAASATWSDGDIYFIGNGSAIEDHDSTFHTNRLHIIDGYIYPSLDTLARIGYEKWQVGDKGTLSIRPLYLKKHPAEMQNIR